MAASNFWDNKKRSAHVITILNNEKKILSDVKNLLDETKDFLEMAKTIDSNDLNGLNWLENESTQLTLKIDELETSILLNGEYDKNDAVLEIHSGAGGTEACDWASMLFRMYSKYAEKNHTR